MANKAGLIFTIFLVVIFCFSFVSADMGPKPTSKISIFYENEKISDNSQAGMFVCSNSNWTRQGENTAIIDSFAIFDEEKNCTWRSDPLAWGGNCGNGVCEFFYFLPDSFRLGVYVPELNKTFITEEIARPNFNSQYRVDLSSDGTAEIRETTSVFDNSRFKSFIYAVIITLIVEMLIWYISVRKIDKKILGWVLLANIISLSLIWFVFYNYFSSFYGLLIAEICVFLFEGIFIYIINKNKITLTRSIITSLIANVTSVIIGIVIILFASFFHINIF